MPIRLFLALGLATTVLSRPSPAQFVNPEYQRQLDESRRRFEEQVRDSERRLRQRQTAEAHKRSQDRTFQLVAMIEATLDGGPSVGAGIVFSRVKDGVHIVTANHVVRRGNRAAEHILIRFKDSP
jgi:hypothetical protein